ncbi:GroES-like protein [Aureobasidium subglaciale]|nr:GroES-like protein [Aureobasidium subglaciale]
MKEAIIRAGPKVEIVDSPVPKAEKGQVVIKVVYSGSNPKDWKYPDMTKKGEMNQGDDICGTVHEVGEGVSEFKKGDRVFAFHQMLAPGGSYAEYAVAWAHTTAYLPDHVSFQEGAALPLASLTSALGLYDRLRLPQPWTPRKDDEKPIPLVIYGASSSIGYYATQFAVRSNIHPIIGVAGRARSHVEKLLDPSKGDTIVDYRDGDEAVQKGIKDALKGAELHHCFDGVSEKGSYTNVAKVMQDGGHITLVLPGRDFSDCPGHVKQSITMVGDVHNEHKDFGSVFFRYIAKGVDEGWFKAQPQEEIAGGLNGVEQGLANLKSGKASAIKYVFKVADTPGAAEIAASIVYREYWKEVCAQCFKYDRGRNWKIRDAKTGHAFCSDECQVIWKKDIVNDEAASMAIEGLGKTGQSNPSDQDYNPAYNLPRPTIPEIESAWKSAEETATKIRAARLSAKPSKPERRLLTQILAVPPTRDLILYQLPALLTIANSPSLWSDVLILESESAPYTSPADLELQITSYHHLLACAPLPLLEYITAENLRDLAAKSSHNVFNIWSQDLDDGGSGGSECLGYGLWTAASYWNHSCGPNIWKRREGRTWKFWAERDVTEGEALCISYLGGDEKDMTRQERRDKLKEHWKFDCACSRCQEEAS